MTHTHIYNVYIYICFLLDMNIAYILYMLHPGRHPQQSALRSQASDVDINGKYNRILKYINV